MVTAPAAFPGEVLDGGPSPSRHDRLPGHHHLGARAGGRRTTAAGRALPAPASPPTSRRARRALRRRRRGARTPPNGVRLTWIPQNAVASTRTTRRWIPARKESTTVGRAPGGEMEWWPSRLTTRGKT